MYESQTTVVVSEQYRNQVEMHLEQSSENTILYGDLGFFIHVAQSDADLDTLIKMVKR